MAATEDAGWVVTRVNGAAAEVMAKPAAKDALAKAGVEAVSTSPERMSEIVHSDLVRWTKITREANITAQ